MNFFYQPTPGIVLLCNKQGLIQEVLHNSIGGSQTLVKGRPVTQIVQPPGLEKMLNFLAELRAQGAAFDWELNVSLDNQPTPLHFTGVVFDNGLLILGSESSQGVKQLYEEMMRINNEQLNTLRSTMKEQSLARREQPPDIYDELSRLNNEMANLQRDLAKKNVELERLNTLKNQFLGMASHDLRSPLAVIISYSEFLLDEAVQNLNDEHVQFLSTIRSSSEFMLSLVDDLLDVTAIEAGKLELNLQLVNLVELVGHSVTLNRVLAARKNIELEFDAQTELPPLEIDRHKIEQVLNNLIGNAVKFSYPHSRVMVRVTQNDGQVTVSVSDAGQGIPAEDLGKLFEPFAKTSVRGTGGEKSTGLGLMIARKVIEAHQGQINVESTVGEGSTFYFTLPLPEITVAKEESPPKAENAGSQAGGRNLRILLAEDSPVNQKMTLHMLKKAGYQARAVASGKAACDAVQAQPYDVILMDLHMPEMDGLEAARFIRRQLPNNRQPYIIAITASAWQEDIQKCLAAGMDDYLTKPIKLDALSQKLAQIQVMDDSEQGLAPAETT